MSLSNRSLTVLAVCCALVAGGLIVRGLTSNKSIVGSVQEGPQELNADQRGQIEIARWSADDTEVHPAQPDDKRRPETNNANSDFSSEVVWFLSSENQDVAQLFDRKDNAAILRAKRASLELMDKLIPCLSQKKVCQYYPNDNQEYYAMGGPPVYNAIERAIDFFELARESGSDFTREIPNGLLETAMGLPSNEVSYKAGTLLLSKSEGIDAKIEVINRATVLGPVARVMFLQYAGLGDERKDRDYANAFNQALEATVSENADARTRSETVKNLDKFDLDENTFRRLAVISCRAASSSSGRASVAAVLERKAKSSGYQLSQHQLCNWPNHEGS